ncbi:hypothetical protein GGR58DRAFT_508047 [Xylaria digitata]|nr:hypothetical protein GGR58DRAFT_508047 [Xylaria digitata]
MSWSELDLVDRRWNSRLALKTLFLAASSGWLSVTKAAALPAQSLQARAAIGGGVDLRVLPIGDSITWGAQSSDDNGYRFTLHESLTALGNNVDFVGSVESGNFADDQHEGHRGYLISGINTASDLGIYAAPNIVLLHAGTNDMYHDTDVTNAPARLKALIDKIYEHSPDAAVFDIQSRIEGFNEAIPALVAEYVDAGKHVTTVSMNTALTASDLADTLHPNDGGYVKMAKAYHAAIEEAGAKGWIVGPGKAEVPPVTAFEMSWSKLGVVAAGACPRAQLHFMDLDGDGLKDYACVEPTTGALSIWLNVPDANGKTSTDWTKLGKVATGRAGRNGTGVLFADLNGDGRDDYIYVDPADGEIYGWINGLRNENDVWQWKDIGRIAGDIGATKDNLQMADLNADGRDDLMIVDQSTGEVTAWLNTGTGDMPSYSSIGVIVTTGTGGAGDMAILGDVTGGGRADFMTVGGGGKTKGLINCPETTAQPPRFVSPFTFAAGPSGAEQDAVRLVDMTGDGRLDYLLVDEKTGKVTLWENNGSGGIC